MVSFFAIPNAAYVTAQVLLGDGGMLYNSKTQVVVKSTEVRECRPELDPGWHARPVTRLSARAEGWPGLWLKGEFFSLLVWSFGCARGRRALVDL